MRRAWLFPGVFLLATLGTARAEPPPQTTKDDAVQLFNEARALMAEGKFGEACPKLERAQAIDPGMGTLFNLSHCYEQMGRIASAWAGFRDVAAAAGTTGQIERERVARDRAAALAPKLSKLRISVPEEAMVAGLEVQRDGIAVSSLLWGTDVPVDPGKHLVTAAAPGKEPWSSSVAVTDPGNVVVVRVPVLAAKAVVPAPPVVIALPPEPEGRSAAPAVLLGVLAAAGVGGGAALFAVAGAKGGEAGSLRAEIGTNGGEDNTCLATPAPLKCAELDSVTRDEATYKTLAVGSFVAGGLAAAGLLLYVFWPSSGDGPSQAPGGRPIRAGFSAGPGGAGAFVVGSF
ncbi:MAG TPA: hypothetical protein VE093_07440 [Polyangiaceae bacterium]|jgi:hypothetical protein|nr:hypothetical protein [Polyangiaceae bacterium]